MTPTPPASPRSSHRQPLPVLALYAVLLAVLAGLSVPLLDLLRPETSTVTASGRVEAPPAAVWSLLARVETYPSWRVSVARVASPDGTGRAPRSRPDSASGHRLPPAAWVERDRDGSRLRVRLVEANPPERLVVAIEESWPSYRGRRVVRLTGGDGETHVFIGQRGTVGDAFSRLADRLFASDARPPDVLLDELRRAAGRR